LLCEIIEYFVPVIEALATRAAVGGGAQISPGALVTVVPTNAQDTLARAILSVTLQCLGAIRVTVTRLALEIRITPVVGLTLVTLASAKAWFTDALSVILIALFGVGTIGVTVAGFTACATGDLPVVLLARVT